MSFSKEKQNILLELLRVQGDQDYNLLDLIYFLGIISSQ